MWGLKGGPGWRKGYAIQGMQLSAEAAGVVKMES